MADSEKKLAWVIGGSGVVGSAVVKELTERGLDCIFTWHDDETRAHALARASGAKPLRFCAEHTQAIEAWVRSTLSEHGVPRMFVYAAGVSSPKKLPELGVDEFEAALRVNVTAPFALLRALANAIEANRTPLDAVLIGALERGQSLPLPVHYATSQGALAALTMAVAGELGPRGVRLNQVALGVLEGGLSRTLDAALVQQYLKFSALRRRGSPEEVARAIAWLLLENTYMTGRVIPVNGGV